jgi:F5/8 type C domain
MHGSASAMNRTGRRRYPLVAAISGLTVLVAYVITAFGSSASALAPTCGTTDIALHQPATASSVEATRLPAANAVDGDASTRWSSAFSDPQWLQVDLGASTAICDVVLTWQSSYARAFEIEISPDGAGNWTPSQRRVHRRQPDQRHGRPVFATAVVHGGVWNMVFSGVAGAPANSFPKPPYTAMRVADVNGVKLAGLLFDAGSSRSPALLQVGRLRCFLC